MQALSQVLVVNSGALCAGSAANPNLVTDGLLAILNEGPLGTLGEVDVTSGTPEANDYTNLVLVRGTAGNSLVTSGIPVASIARITKRDYRAPVAQVVTLSTIPAVPAGGGTYTFRVQNRHNQSEQPNRWHTYTKDYEAGESLVIADLLALVNDNAASVVTATGTTTVILTADDAAQAFDVATDELLTPGQGITETLTTPIVYGVGTAAQVLALEKEVAGSYGEYTVPGNLLGPRPNDSFVYPPRTFSDGVGHYNMYTLEVVIDNDDSINRAFQHQEIILAIEDSATNEATFDLFWSRSGLLQDYTTSH